MPHKWKIDLDTQKVEFRFDGAALMRDIRRDITFESDYDGVLQACCISALTIDEDASRGEGTTRAEAAAHALEALLLARQAAQASQEAGTDA